MGYSFKMAISSFRDLIVWQKSFKLTKDVYSLCRDLPKSEQYGICSQLQRCAVSIPSNISVGQQRNNRAEYRQFLGIARGSAAELETQLLLVQDIYKLSTSDLVDETHEIQKILQAIIAKL